MHIAFLTPEYPHSNSTPSGGLGTSIKNLAISLVENQIEISVFIYGQKKSLILQENGITFYFIKQISYKILGWYSYRKYIENYLNKKIKELNIDLVEAPDWTGITAFMKLSCPLIIRMNGSDAYFCHLEGRKQKWKNRFFEKLALNSADALISVSSFTAEKTKEIFNIERSITVVHNSIDASKFIPSENPAVSNRVLYFGTLIRKKGVLELSEIFNKLVAKKPDIEILLIGRDVIDKIENKSTLELFKKQLIEEARNRITHLPEIVYEGIKEQIEQASVVVLPSFAEALPMTWLEAMAMEKAIVTSNIGWAKEVMIDNQTGYTEDPKDHEAYAEKILLLLNDKKMSISMGKAARKQVLLNFSTTVVVEKNIKFYKSQISAFRKNK